MKTHSPFAHSRRNGRRFPFSEQVTVQTNECMAFQACDLSLLGLGLKGSSMLNPGSDLILRIDFVNDIETHFAHGKVCWSSKEGFGVVFDNLANGAQRGITEFISRQRSASCD